MTNEELLISFWEKELPAFREVIRRIPEGSEYRPDPKSRTAREIAWLIVYEHKVLVEGLERGAIKWAELPAPATIREIIAEYDKIHQSSIARLRKLTAEDWARDLPFMFGDVEAMKSPANEMAWGFLFDTVHHRGQLSTYLRPMGAKVPAIYGPSADEKH